MTQLAETTTSEEETAAPALPPPSISYRLLRTTGWTLVWLGALTLGFVVHQLWITSFFARQNQADLAIELEEYFSAAEITEVVYTPALVDDPPQAIVEPDAALEPDATVSPEEVATPRTIQVEAAPEKGTAFAEIRIPSLPSLADGWAVVEGVSLGDLRNGAGHMPWTPLPGQPGNAVIAGHRTTYGAPFRDLDLLEIGDVIEVETALGVHTYAVREVLIVRPTDVWVTKPRPGSWLTLTTCNPKFSARERLVVFAELISGPNADVILGQA